MPLGAALRLASWLVMGRNTWGAREPKCSVSVKLHHGSQNRIDLVHGFAVV